MSYTIASVENEGKPVRTYDGRNGKVYVFNVTTTEGAMAQAGKQKPEPPQVGDTYNTLSVPPDNAPEGALPTLKDKDYEASPAPLDSGNGGHTSAGAASGDGKNYNRQTNPEDAKRMGRCHAQDMALQWTAIQSQRGKVPDDFGYEQLTPIINWFEKDVAS